MSPELRARRSAEGARIGLGGLCLVTSLLVAAPVGAQVRYRGSATTAFVEHRVDAGRGVERASGALFGALATASVGPWLEAHGLVRGGSLGADTSLAEDRRVAELELGASAIALPWLSFQLATNVRSYSTDLARQRWISVRAGAEGHFGLIDERFRGMVGLTLMPIVSVGGLESPDLALSGAVGLEYRSGMLSAALSYSIERYDFPARSGVRRLEQLSELGIRVGVSYIR